MQQFTFNDVPQLLASIVQTQTQILKALKTKPAEDSKTREILNTTEASEFLGINRSTLWKWEKELKIKSYAIDGRKFFKRSELVQSLIPFNH